MYYRETVDKMNKAFKESNMWFPLLSLETSGIINVVSDSLKGYPISFGTIQFCSILIGAAIIYKKINGDVVRNHYLDDGNKEALELKCLYDEYIYGIANIINSFDYKTTIDLCVALDLLLHDGVFSYENNYKYYDHKKNRKEIEPLLGTYILEGKGVCRHEAMFMSNLFDELGIRNFRISVKMGKGIFEKSDGLHAIVGVIDPKGFKYAYDFTNHLVCGFDGDEIITYLPLLGEIGRYIIKTVHDSDYDEINSTPNLCFDKIETFPFDLMGGLLATILKGDLINYKNNNKELVDNIANKSLILMPRR